MKPPITDLLGLPYTRLNWIEPGSFLFQDELEVTFQNGFYAGCYQVTQELYKKVTVQNPSYFKGKHRPVEQVSWRDAQEFLEKLNKQIPLNDGLQFRLPTETQWEYVARANQKFEYSGSQKVAEVGWYNGNANKQTMPVGLKEPNAWGLYDLAGNVWEWCADAYREEVNRIPTDGTALEAGEKAIRVVRGGSWFSDEDFARVSIRNRYHDVIRYYDNIGFRVFRY
jgi:formylglycine-generating enzyme